MRRLVLLLPLIVGLLAAGSALATPIHVYAELKTSTAVRIPGHPALADATIRLGAEFDFGAPNFGLGGIDLIDLSHPGLGSSRVPPVKSYSHSFAPEREVEEVLRARLFVLLADFDCEHERFGLRVNGEGVARGRIDDFDFFGGRWELVSEGVRPLITGAGDGFDVDVASLPLRRHGRHRGDFDIVASALVVGYRSGPPVPEPTAAAVFAVGILLIGGVTARRRA